MRLRVYHAGDGDCLLLRNHEGERSLLIDGGRAGTFNRHTNPDLTMDRIDVVCVSHIDDDHISGILRMFDNEVAWRRHLFERSRNLPTEEPSERRPPEVGEIWHNALFALVGEDLEVQAQNALANTANLLRSQGLEELALDSENIINGERSAMELSRRISDQQLGIRLNDSAEGAIMTRDTARGRRFGRLRIKVIGPSQDDIDRLRVRWSRFIKQNPTAISQLRDELRRDERSLDTAAGAALDLGEGVESLSAPNLASIMLLGEEGEHSVLLTGDGDSAEILDGLAQTGEIEPLAPDDDLSNLSPRQRRHVTFFKVPHHGATANVTEELVARITGDHYIFCGNGAHHNPELIVVRSFAEARLDRGLGPDEPFTFWFSSGARTRDLSDARRRHMEEVEAEVESLVARSGGRMRARFIQRESFLDVQ